MPSDRQSDRGTAVASKNEVGQDDQTRLPQQSPDIYRSALGICILRNTKPQEGESVRWSARIPN